MKQLESVKDMSLRPNDQVQKLLLSTPAKFVGELDTPEVLITHAWPPMHRGPSRWFSDGDDSLRRTAIILAFQTSPPPERKVGVVLPNYEPGGDIVAAALSVLFGKRFDSHGPFEMSGFYGMPDVAGFSTPCDPRLIHNNLSPRANRGIPLNFGEARRILNLLLSDEDNPRMTAFHSAARFYNKALATVESDPEGAYLNLVTAGEIIASFHKTTEGEALDREATAALESIRTKHPDGEQLAKFLRKRLRGIKRGFVNAITSMVDDTFFEASDAPGHGELKKEDFAKRIGAAYDLRSQFVHSGSPFGGWIRPSATNYETQIGRPVVANKDMASALALAPLFVGLERVIRYVLLSFAAELGADV
ncbi:hypothetical protein ACSV5K_10230 [Agrobacterium pusense]|uniref:hypothetical protein n=1 Tax=Agrobacterium pusense TaxID=648995 RepID=UPI003FCF2581